MSFNKKTIEDIDVSGKKVLVRCDFNVPLDENKDITDETRINAALPTIKYLLEHGAAVILTRDLVCPKGEFNMKYSLAPVAKRLSEKLGFEVKLAKDVIGPDAKKLAAEVKPGEAVLLENVRFHAEEEKNDPAFAKELASMADIYVSDAFGTVHRAHASTAGVAQYLPAVAGFLIGKELNFLGKAVTNPERPFVAILGGAKVKDKIGVITNLIEKVDTLLIGGGMAYTLHEGHRRRDRQLPLRRRAPRPGAGAPGQGKGQGRQAAPARGQRLRQGIQQRHRADGLRVRQDPRGLGRHGHRPEDGRALCCRDQGRQDGGLERPDGRVRDAELCQGHLGHRHGHGRI